jgi:hypothetical protein
MPLTEFTIILIEIKLTEYIDQRNPVHIRDQVKLTYKFVGNRVNLIEARRYHRDPTTWIETPIAQFRFDQVTNKWSLYFMDRNSYWHLYDLVKPSANFEDILREVDSDPTGIFWG